MTNSSSFELKKTLVPTMSNNNQCQQCQKEAPVGCIGFIKILAQWSLRELAEDNSAMEIEKLVATFRIVREISHDRCITSVHEDGCHELLDEFDIVDEQAVWLPGYECQMSQDAEKHSRQKLMAATSALSSLSIGVTVDTILSPARECQACR